MTAPRRPTWLPPGMSGSAVPVTHIHPEPNAGHRSVLVIPGRPSQGKAGRPRRPGRARFRAPITGGRRIAAGCRATPHQAISVLGSSCIVSLVIASCQEAQRLARPVWPGRRAQRRHCPASARELGWRGLHRPGRAGFRQHLEQPGRRGLRGWLARLYRPAYGPRVGRERKRPIRDGQGWSSMLRAAARTTGQGAGCRGAGPAEVFCLIMVLHAATRGQGVAGSARKRGKVDAFRILFSGQHWRQPEAFPRGRDGACSWCVTPGKRRVQAKLQLH
jgi:hypothetical protein